MKPVKINQSPGVIEINDEMIMALFVRLFKALKAAFDTPTESGGIRAYELIETLTETAENDPDVFRAVLTEDNIAAFTRLQKKAQTGKVGLNDLLTAFPGIGNAMKGGGFKNFF
ncbi:hypothetical protein [Spirosoma areae]